MAEPKNPKAPKVSYPPGRKVYVSPANEPMKETPQKDYAAEDEVKPIVLPKPKDKKPEPEKLKPTPGTTVKRDDNDSLSSYQSDTVSATRSPSRKR